MNFGQVDSKEINKIDFTLPQDGVQTKLTLTGERIDQPKFYVGCAKWGRNDWVDLIYPPKTQEKDFLIEYIKQFNSVELNATFYRMPKKAQIKKWRAAAIQQPDFLFCPKISRSISHTKRLNNAVELTGSYLKAITEFKNHLGPCFLQLPTSFTVKNLETLRLYLTSLPKNLSFFVELRNRNWFAKSDVMEALFAMRADLKIGAAITDTSGRRDALHMELPTPKAFVRFVGNGGAFLNSDKQRIDDWVQRLREWLANGLEEIYFFLHQHDERDTPLIADYTIAQFNKILGSKVPRLKFMNP